MSSTASTFGHLVEHLLEDLVFSVNLAFVEVLNSISRRAKLYQDDRSFLDGDVPVILEVKNQLPNRQTDEL